MPKYQRIANQQNYTADGAITQFMVVVEGTNDGDVAPPGAADAGSIVGVALAAADDNEQVDVARPGDIVPCIASAAISRGDLVSIAGTSGKVKTAAPAGGSNTYLVGQAQNAAGADGDHVYVLITLGTLQG